VRGTCTFGTKARNAQLAGAEAVIIFNQGNTPDREGLIVANATTLDDGTVVSHDIPVVGASFADGVALAQPGSTAYIEVRTPEIRTDYNVIAELEGKNNDNVVMAGAHLDASPRARDQRQRLGLGRAARDRPDDGQAPAGEHDPVRVVGGRGARTDRLDRLLEGLSQAERDRIALYLNYDMVGSPNYIFMVNDADESTFPAPVPIPEGSVAIEDLYESYYTLIGEPYDDTEVSGRSDYQAFIEAGIPSGGLFTGAEEIKTPEQQAIWGGIAGEQFDPCYHEACDTLENYDPHALEVNSDLALIGGDVRARALHAT
jgi:Peptidase family M28/PA domain